jgi:hypothetical protein
LFANTYYKTSEFPRGRNTQLFALPVYSWEIYLSSPRGRSLNLFEKVILELIRVTGERSLSSYQIADWLGLEEEMVVYILTATMQPNGWLDKNFKITTEGMKLLDSNSDAEMTSALIFQCAVTGKWLPRIAYQVNEVQPVGLDKSLAFKLDRASGRTARAYRIRHCINTSQEPGELVLNDIVEKDNDARWVAFNVMESVDSSGKSSDRVILSSKSVHAAYIMVWADKSSGYKFDFIDPFALSKKASWMHDIFEQASTTLPELQQFALSKFDNENEELSYTENLKFMQEKARLEVMIEYPNVKSINGLIEPLFELLNDKEKLVSNKNQEFSLNRSVVNSSGSIVEILCKHILAENPLKRVDVLPAPNLSNDSKKRELSNLLKAATKLTNNQIYSVLKVQPGKVYQTAIGRNSTMRSLLATIFISMKEYPHHPMKFLISDVLLFDEIYTLSFDRDEASHGNNTKYTREQALKYINIVDKFLKNIL